MVQKRTGGGKIKDIDKDENVLKNKVDSVLITLRID